MSDRNKIKKNRLLYTCNCGWLDLNHLEDPSTRPFVGATNLWKQLNDNERNASLSRTCFKRDIGRKTIFSERYRVTKRAKFSDGSTGYKVTYKQDMGNKYFTTGITKSYLVKYGLTLAQKQSVALSIFMEVSILFESYQDSFPWNIRTDSGFSLEDLVSDLLGFYIAIGIYTKEDIFRLCHKVSIDTALKIWDRDGPVGEIKNNSFNPIFSENTTNFKDERKSSKECSIDDVDECINQKKVFPDEFKKIRPAIKGKHFIDLPKLGVGSCK